MRNIMYLRPGNLFKDFFVEESKTTIRDNGRPLVTYSPDRNIVIRGVLAEADIDQKVRFRQDGHPITHTIVEYARRKAKEDDRLHLGDRTFLVNGIDEAGNLGICTIYYVEERNDVK